MTVAPKTYPCVDCERNWGRYRQATVFLAEGRYLCQECAGALSKLRAYVRTGGKR